MPIMPPDNLPEQNDAPKHWLNQNVIGMCLTSFFCDFCHEMATAALPQFMQVIGASAGALGFIEGIADALSSFIKLAAGFYSDKIGHRKPWTVAGYFLTGVAVAAFAFAFAWPLILIGRVIAWLGKGIRGPLRDALLADSVGTRDRGKAFGFHRATDTAGAVAGPLAVYLLLGWLEKHPVVLEVFAQKIPLFSEGPGNQFRIIFFLALLPGMMAVASMALLVTEKRSAKNSGMRFWRVLHAFPRDFRKFLLAVALFGMADFAPTLMILRATTLLEPEMGLAGAARLGALLYLCRNIVYAAVSYPIGVFSGHFPHTRYLAAGYGVAVVCFLGFAFAPPSPEWLTACFVLAGIFIAWEDTIEGVTVRDYVNAEVAGTAYGMLGAVNGAGDFFSSAAVGIIWATLGPVVAFLFAAAVATAGFLMMASLKAHTTKL